MFYEYCHKLTRLISVCLFGPGGQGLLLHSLIKSFRSSAAWMEYEMGTFSFGLILICSIPTIKGPTLRKRGKVRSIERE